MLQQGLQVNLLTWHNLQTAVAINIHSLVSRCWAARWSSHTQPGDFCKRQLKSRSALIAAGSRLLARDSHICASTVLTLLGKFLGKTSLHRRGVSSQLPQLHQDQIQMGFMSIEKKNGCFEDDLCLTRPKGQFLYSRNNSMCYLWRELMKFWGTGVGMKMVFTQFLSQYTLWL